MTPVANFDSMGCLKLGGHISGVPVGADILGEPDIHAQHERFVLKLNLDLNFKFLGETFLKIIFKFEIKIYKLFVKFHDADVKNVIFRIPPWKVP